MKYSILILLAALALPFAARSQAVILKTDTVSVSCSSSDTFLVPVRVRNFTGVASMQFTLSWTPSQLKYAYVTPGANNPFYLGGATAGFDTTTLLINQGKLTFAWTKQGGASYPDDTPVFFVAFRRLSGPFSPVTFVNAPVGIEVTDKNADELPFQLMPGGVLPIDTVPPTITCPPSPPPVQSSGPAPVNGISPTSVRRGSSPHNALAISRLLRSAIVTFIVAAQLAEETALGNGRRSSAPDFRPDVPPRVENLQMTQRLFRRRQFGHRYELAPAVVELF